MESLVGNRLYEDVMHLNNNKICTLTPELQLSPFLKRLLLQENNTLTWLPKFFFRNMPVLLVLNLSHTSIQSLPPSISKLCSLEEFVLRDCSLLIELPPEIGALKNLKLFDLEGTEVMYLPKEIGKLGSLERLRVSLSTYADDYKDRHVIQHIIPRMTILKLTKLKELSISVSPEAEWWEVELLEAVMRDLLFLPDLKILKLYLPTAKALQQFLRLERYKVPIYSSLWNFRFMTGRCEELPLSVHLDTEENFLKLEKCVKYMNGEGNNDEMVELISDARALYLRRHWTVEKLSMFDIRKLKYCLLMECNEMRTLVDQDDFCKDRNKSTSRSEEEELLGSLQYLSIHFLKKLQSISKGLIGRNSLSCLRILALHTCPELTSIFTECLLDNLQSLTEIIVEDCPKVNCLIKLEEGERWRYGPFLPNLRRVSLLDLPELVSVSGGVCIAPQLDTLLVFNCMKLAYLSVMEIPRDTRSIKGEIEWWDALKYGKLTWESVFVQLKRDGSLMDQLAEDTNSLQHFLELEMLPSLPGQVNRKSSRDTKEDSENADQFQIVHNVDLSNETQKMSTLKILNCNNGTQSHYARTAFRMWEPPSPMSVKPDNKDTNCNLKAPSHKLPSTKKLSRSADIAKWIRQVKENPNDARKYLQNKSFRSKYKSSNSTVTSTHRVKVNKGVEDEKALDDGYMWRKYGAKFILGSKFPRAYYRCCFGSRYGCSAKKHVQRSDDDPSVFQVTYRGKHTCPIDLSNSFSSTATESACTTLTLRGSSTATESASRITESHFELAKRPQVLDSNKSKSVSSMDAKRIQLLKVSPNTGFDTPPDDGYIWRKHGQPDKIRATYPKLYYRCNSCDAKKLVQRSDDDPSFWIVTYEGYHTCRCLSASNFSCESKSTTSILKGSESPTTIESELRNLKSSGSSIAVESTSSATDNSSGQNYTKKMSGSASIQRCKQQAEEIQSPLQFQIPSSYEPNQMIISKVQENDSRNISSSAKTPLNAKQCPSPDLKVRKEKLGDRITELQQLVSPFGKTDTASVLEETCDYIKFLHEQVKVLLTSYVKQETPLEPKQQALKQDLRNKGLCLVPSQAHFHLLIKQEPNAYKTDLFPYSGML